VAAFFTLVFPVSFVVVICAIAGNATIDSRSGVRFAQFLVPVFAVFGACMAAFVSLALAVAYARESGVLKRLRSTPLPPWIHLAGRVVAAIWVSLIAFALVTAVGIVFYGVQVVWRTLPAVLVTFAVGVTCFAALGLAVVSLAPTAGATQAIANGSLILLAFVSDVFIVTLPEWLSTVGWVFPLKHFVNAVADASNPNIPGSGFGWVHLGVMLAWAALGAVVALRFFTWEQRPSRREGRSAPPAQPAASRAQQSSPPLVAGAAIQTGRRTWPSLAWGQIRFTTVKLLRDPLAVFFAVAFPVVLLVFFSMVYGRTATWGGLPLPEYLAAVFAVYGVAVMCYVNLPSTVAEDRAKGVLKRLRGTPLPASAYLAGRVGGAVVLGAGTVVIMLGVGVAFFEVRPDLTALLASALAFGVTIACAAALGLVLVSLVDSPASVTAVALATLLPLSMVSDIFINAPNLPAAMSAVGWTFPLRHMATIAASAGSDQAFGTSWWGHLAVVAAWGLVAGVVAWRTFRWEKRT
jgi:ABC-type multidrug transport system permease subunit